MGATVHPGGFRGGAASVPGDKSIAHRWLILAATARGRSELRGLPEGLDVKTTARCLAAISSPRARAALDGWGSSPGAQAHGDRSTSNDPRPGGRALVLEADGRASLEAPSGPLDCSNSGTTMRLLAGVLASAGFHAVLFGDASLSGRPMERVAEPLVAMGAEVRTTDGHPPIAIVGGPLRGIDHRPSIPSSQVKGAVLLAGLAAEGETTVVEPAPTRDHTERALAHLGAPVEADPGRASVRVRAFQHEGFAAAVPGDVSSAAFLVAAALITGTSLEVAEVGLNASRTHYVKVFERMGASMRSRTERDELGEPVGTLEVDRGATLHATTIPTEELPLVVDEVPVIAAVAAYAGGETRFEGAGELRVKESDRLRAIEGSLRALGGDARVEGDLLVVSGDGLRGGRAPVTRDHRIAMAVAVAGLGAREPTIVDGIEAADVSFPGFVASMSALGARVEG